MDKIVLFLCCAALVHSKPSISSRNVVFEFDNGTPSFVIRKSPEADFFLTLSYLDVKEIGAKGTVVRDFQISELSFGYSYTNNTERNNTLNTQVASFKAGFGFGAHLEASFMPWNNTPSTEISIGNSTYRIYANHPSCFFSVSLTNWKFDDPSNFLDVRVLVIINVGALSISAQETGAGFVLGMPYYNDYLLAKFPKTVVLDNSTVQIKPDYQINSISQPISATFSVTIPSFQHSAVYSASTVTMNKINPPANTLQVVIIVVGVLAGVGVLIGILAFVLTRDSEPEVVEEITDEERKRLQLLQQVQYNSFERSLGNSNKNTRFPVIGKF